MRLCKSGGLARFCLFEWRPKRASPLFSLRPLHRRGRGEYRFEQLPAGLVQAVTLSELGERCGGLPSEVASGMGLPHCALKASFARRHR